MARRSTPSQATDDSRLIKLTFIYIYFLTFYPGCEMFRTNYTRVNKFVIYSFRVQNSLNILICNVVFVGYYVFTQVCLWMLLSHRMNICFILVYTVDRAVHACVVREALLELGSVCLNSGSANYFFTLSEVKVKISPANQLHGGSKVR